MDPTHFDNLARALATRGLSRRRLLRDLGAALGGAFALSRPALAARCNGQACSADSDCCGALACVGGACAPPRQSGGNGNGGRNQGCSTGQNRCGGTCTDLQTDTANCGTCGHACGAGQGCCRGVCTDLGTASNCGQCGNACTTNVANATSTCAGGTCSFVCNANYSNCGGACVDETSDLNNCGACGNACPVPANAAAACANGACGFTCQTGFADCNNDAGDGCEANLATDASNCGACGKPCAAGEACAGGKCTCGTAGDCAAEGENCCTNTCVNEQTDPNHCGACGNACPTPANATATCNGGTCGSTCNPGFHACGGACVGNSDPATCGTSCTACPVPAHGAATCDGTSCGVACDDGYAALGGACCPAANVCGGVCLGAPCDATACERCDATGGACAVCGGDTTETCLPGTGGAAGTCRAACSGADGARCGTAGVCCGGHCIEGGACCGDGDCAANAGTICCGNRCVADDTAEHCGACDVSCGGTHPTCYAGPPAQCICFDAVGNDACGGNGLTCCWDGFVCVDLNTDVNNCGGCANSCENAVGAVGTPFCANGQCSTQCPDGSVCPGPSSFCCPNQFGSSCANVETDPDNCGYCGNACPNPGTGGTRVCNGGNCQPECPGLGIQCGAYCCDHCDQGACCPTERYCPQAILSDGHCCPAGQTCDFTASGTPYCA